MINRFWKGKGVFSPALCITLRALYRLMTGREINEKCVMKREMVNNLFICTLRAELWEHAEVVGGQEKRWQLRLSPAPPQLPAVHGVPQRRGVCPGAAAWHRGRHTHQQVCVLASISVPRCCNVSECVCLYACISWDTDCISWDGHTDVRECVRQNKYWLCIDDVCVVIMYKMGNI